MPVQNITACDFDRGLDFALGFIMHDEIHAHAPGKLFENLFDALNIVFRETFRQVQPELMFGFLPALELIQFFGREHFSGVGKDFRNPILVREFSLDNDEVVLMKEMRLDFKKLGENNQFDAAGAVFNGRKNHGFAVLSNDLLYRGDDACNGNGL